MVKCPYDKRRNSKGAAMEIQEQMRTDEKLRTPKKKLTCTTAAGTSGVP